MQERVLAPMRHPHFLRAGLGDGRDELAPIGVVRDHERKLDALLARSRAHPHPARGESGDGVRQPARPAVGDGRRRREHDLALELVAGGAGCGFERPEADAEGFVERATFGERAMKIDRTVVARVAQEFKQSYPFDGWITPLDSAALYIEKLDEDLYDPASLQELVVNGEITTI